VDFVDFRFLDPPLEIVSCGGLWRPAVTGRTESTDEVRPIHSIDPPNSGRPPPEFLAFYQVALPLSRFLPHTVATHLVKPLSTEPVIVNHPNC